MLQSLHRALTVNAPRNADIARHMGRSGQTVTAWLGGRLPVPPRCRPKLAAYLGAEIDWQEYQAEFEAAQNDRKAAKSPPVVASSDLQPPTPPKPAQAISRPDPAPARPIPAPPRLVSPPATVPPAKRGLFQMIFNDDEGTL